MTAPQDQPGNVPAHPCADGRVQEALALLEAGIDALTAELDHLDDPGGTPPAALTSLAALTARLRRIESRTHAARLRVLPHLDDDGRWALDGSRSFAHWLARTERITLTTARREVRTARTLRDTLPVTATAAVAGTIGPDHLRALVDIAPTSGARREALAAPLLDAGDTGDNGDNGDTEDRPPTGEEYLVSIADIHPIETFRRLVRRFAHVADPDADDRGYVKAREKEFLAVSPTFDGYHVAGFLTVEHGQALRTALDAVMGPPAAADTRTTPQRRAQGLTDLARIALDNAAIGTGAAVRPHLNVTVSYTELLALADHAGTTPRPDHDDSGDAAALTGPARITGPAAGSPPTFADHDSPIPRDLLRRLACDSEVSRIVFGPDSEILDVGRRRRTVTGQLRRAVITRDQHCTWPGCHEPPARCEVHHAVTHWADGGTTSVHNAALLCWHHHDRVDTHAITMRWHHGHWQFHDRHGHEITDDPMTDSPMTAPAAGGTENTPWPRSA